jgi:hypothetical protein
MTHPPAGFVQLADSIFQSLAACLRDLPVPRYSALFFLLDKSVAIHDGHGIIWVGPENSEIYKCLESAMGNRTEGVIVVDRHDRQAWWAPGTDGTEFVAQHNSTAGGEAERPAAKLVH